VSWSPLAFRQDFHESDRKSPGVILCLRAPGSQCERMPETIAWDRRAKLGTLPICRSEAGCRRLDGLQISKHHDVQSVLPRSAGSRSAGPKLRISQPAGIGADVFRSLKTCTPEGRETFFVSQKDDPRARQGDLPNARIKFGLALAKGSPRASSLPLVSWSGLA
jgi:hypothetical protein